MQKIALLVTCLVDQVHPEIGIATVALLERAGFEVAFPSAQTCCGQPFHNSGYFGEARRLARRTIEIFEPYEKIVLPSGSCTAMIRAEYLHLFADEPDWLSRAGALAAKTFELSEFLMLHGPQALAEQPAETVTYHDSCHMCRLIGLRKEPRAALQHAGIDVTEMAEADRCCGFGGTFSLKMPEVSEAMTREKLRQAAATGATRLVTADPGCLMQMRRFAAEEGVQVDHLAVVLAERAP